MKKSIGYYLLMAFTWPMQLFPLEFHFIISDILFVITYHIIGYRKSVVQKNLLLSFPEKSVEERKQIEIKFYHHLCDIFIEVLYLTHISQKEHQRRISYENVDFVNDMYEKGINVVCFMGHYGNWDFSTLLPFNLKHPVYAIYKRMSSRPFDEFYKKVRGKDGIQLLEMNESYRQLIKDKREKKSYIAFLIADQRPLHHEIKCWMNFLNQETPIIVGPEKIARKMNNAVVWSEVTKVKRGVYKHVFKLITDEPQSLSEYEISRMCMSELEHSIRKYPENWLWSHNRWKYKKGE